MLHDPVFQVGLAACLSVLLVLAIGLFSFNRGGDFNKKYGNKLMRLRIIAQGTAVALILIMMWLRSKG